MKSRFYTAKAFTLTEVIVGMVVVTIIGVVAWMAVNVLNPATRATQYRIKAEHLITLCQEELHQYAQNQANFDTTLNTCNFDQPGNSCGFTDVRSQFPEYSTPSLNFIAADSTPNLKKFDIQVTWQELGKTQTRDSVILLARPPDPLPGNIAGLVHIQGTSTVLRNVNIVIQNISNPATDTYNSQATGTPCLDGEQCNYTFAQPGTGFFVLGAGTWNLTATLPGYVTFSDLGIVVGSSQEVYVDIPMVPNLPIAKITGNVFRAPGVPANFGNSSLYLYEKGGSPSNVTQPGVSGFEFDVSFTDSNPRCFTLFTENAYRSNLVGNFTCNGFSYQAQGWSSAQADINNNVLNCGAPWQGDASSDNICVTPGQTTPVYNILLTPLPTATITVYAVDQNNNPIPASAADPVVISVYGYGGTIYSQTAETGPGPYTVQAPAEQDFLPDGDDVQIYAQWGVPVLQCCNLNATVERYSNVQSVGPLPPNQSTTLTINTITATQQCGNANGQVIDAKTSASLPDAQVSLSGIGQTTNGDGQFAYQCTNALLYDEIPAGRDGITASDSGYYTFSSSGNSFYSATGGVSVIANQSNNVGTTALWPVGFGTITGTVTEEGTNAPLNGITVVLNLGTGGGPLTATTNSDGTFAFNNVPETWPPPALVGNPSYKQAVLDHSLSVAASELYQAYSSGAITLNAGTTQNINIVLTPNSAF